MTTRKRPAPPQSQPSPNATNGYAKSTAITRFYGHDRHEAMTAEDREDLAVITAAAARGYRIAVQCLDCGHWLSSPASVRRHLGPKCAAKAVGR
jgi:primosomal protein N'